MKIKNVKTICFATILVIGAIAFSYSARSELDYATGKVRTTRSIAGIEYHTQYWNTWLTQYSTIQLDTNWHPIETYTDRIVFYTQSVPLFHVFDGVLSDIRNRLWIANVEEDSFPIVANAILNTLNQTSSESEILNRLNCFIQSLPEYSSVDQVTSHQEIEQLLAECFDLTPPE